LEIDIKPVKSVLDVLYIYMQQQTHNLDNDIHQFVKAMMIVTNRGHVLSWYQIVGESQNSP
jgi:hypothetical protein